MSGKYFAAHLIQFNNRDEKEAYLRNCDAVHVSGKIVHEIMKRYEDKKLGKPRKTVDCYLCGTRIHGIVHVLECIGIESPTYIHTHCYENLEESHRC